MRMYRLVPLLTVAALAVGCSERADPLTFEVPVVFNQAPSHAGVHNTHMTGAEEVPANDSRAQGQATFRLSSDGTELSYKLIVANIHNLTQAHIHLAPAGTNGPVVLWLYPSGPPAQPIPGRTQGVLAERTVTAANLVGPLAGASMQDLVDAIRAGNTYVNVHTQQYPPGEIRGQIRYRGP
jgi:hypothetical protein